MEFEKGQQNESQKSRHKNLVTMHVESGELGKKVKWNNYSI